MIHSRFRSWREQRLAAALSACLAASCTGVIPTPAGEDSEVPGTGGAPGTEVPKGLPERQLAATLGLRRLSVEEYDNTIRDLLGDGSQLGATYLPKDVRKAQARVWFD